MKIIDPGHQFELQSFDGFNPQIVDFMKRIGEGYPGNNGPAKPGTNCQEVLRMQISRVVYLNRQDPSDFNGEIVKHLREALLLFETRAAIRHGKRLVGVHSYLIEQRPFCPACGHIREVCNHETEKSKGKSLSG